MGLQQLNFKNILGHTLVGRLELPVVRCPHNEVVFAHCFPHNKNFTAVKNITKALSLSRFGVLRLYISSLCDSSWNFSEAPTLLIGHSYAFCPDLG
ncbi:MAG: hypothetical protein E4H26_01210 [Flavobacteriales bacterium]|nr:MAG: hypothetical protein E4H26_01210 [Flavobacteriales bacterium]